MIYPHLDPVLLQLGPIAIRWYALAYIAGILLGWRYGVWLSRDAKLWRGLPPTLNEQQIDDLVLWLTLAILIGGRLGYILFYDTEVIWKDPMEIVQAWHGGMSFHGAFFTVCLVVIWFSIKSLGVPAWRAAGRVFTPWKAEARAGLLHALRIADLTAPCAPFGLFFGRLANYNNGELWGRPTSLPWGLIFPNADFQPRHPSQLYEAGLEGIVMFLILRFATHHLKWLPRRGAVSGLFFACYGLFRIALENVREPDRNMPHFPLGLTMGIMLSLPMVAIGAWLLWLSCRPGAMEPEVVAPPSADAAPAAV